MLNFTKKDVFEKLKTVIDPELQVNIVDLGLIYSVEVGEDLKIEMTLTTPGCPLAPVINSMVLDAIDSLPGFSSEKLQLHLTFDPPWTPEMMTEEVRAELGIDEW
ncbi:metal-sulfur cluster assembly factor [Patescibacteria group bacterium]